MGRSLALLFAAFMALLALPAQAQLTLPSSFSLSPSAASGGGTISIGGSRLADGHYEVLLIEGRVRTTLVDIAAGTGEFQRYVKLPALAAGIYTVELHVDGALRESRSYKIISPLSVTPASSSPRAGSTLNFTVSGLTKGSLSLLYAGKTAFGPVNVDGGSYSGKLVLPTDRPASLPANVRLDARNAVGKTVPRVGSATLAVQTADKSPLVRIGSSTLSSSNINPRQTLNVTGTVVTNDFIATQAQTQYWWKGADGRVVPMGAQRAVIGNDGSFAMDMRAPQLGTLSAGSASGAGSVFGVGQGRDQNGVLQQRPSAVDQNLSVGFDTDAAIDIGLTLTGSDGLRISNARVVLSTEQLDELYPSNDNQSPIRTDGGVPPGQIATQFDSAVVADELIGCPDDLERQTSDANGRVAFEFGLDVPQGGYNVDGSGPAPTLTIEPTEDCSRLPTNPNQSTAYCTVVDPAGVHATLTIIAAHTGYGWVSDTQANGFPLELPLKVHLRIDRYTGQVTTNTCPPDTNPLDANVPPCNEQSFARSAVLSLTLPKLAASGLLLTDPTWVEGANATWPWVSGRDGLILNYVPMPDLSAFEGKADFAPEAPMPRKFTIGYVRGAGNTLQSATLHLPGQTPIELGKRSGSDSCDTSATELWGVDSALDSRVANFLQALRFPSARFGANKNSVIGYVVAKEMGTSRAAVRAFRFYFAKTDAPTRSIADLPCPAGQPFPCVAIDAYKPHQVKVTTPPSEPKGDVSTGNGNTSGCDSSDCDDYSELQSKTNSAQAHLDQQFCLPKGATQCNSYSSVDSSHQQYSRQADVAPPGAGFTGAGGDSQTDAPWEVLFDKTIPLFRWYWGVPELFSAEVFADLGLRAEYLFNYVIKPLEPLTSYIETGGRMNISIVIGVDVDVLFGILVDAGAAITGKLQGEVVARAEADAPTSPCIDEKLSFGLDFSYWVEIGCPFPNPFDPTCYIPDIEGNHNIFSENLVDGTSCLANKRGAPQPWAQLEQRLAALSSGKGTLPPIGPIMAVSAEQRRAMNRHPAISIDSAGNKLVLYITDLGKLSANDIPDGGTRTTTTLSSAHGLRDVAVMHYATDRAVAVWAQSDLTGRPADGTDLASRQYLRYAIFDGDSWSAAQNLTSPGYGEGGVRLARCKPRPMFYRSDCGDKVGLVFQRNTARRMGGESHIYSSRFDGVNWTSPQRVDQSGMHNITPAIAYQNGSAVVAWVRYAPDATGLSEVSKRNLALRVLDGSDEEVHTHTTRVAQPDIAVTSTGRVALAYTRAASADAFVGTRQALQLGERTCSDGVCALRTFAVRDAHRRLIYGERPRIVPNISGGVDVAFRGLSFGAIPGAASPESNLLPGDPIGMLTSRGELLKIVSNLSAGQTIVQNLTNDAGGHFQTAVAFDPVAQELVTLSATVEVDPFIAKRKDEQPSRSLAKVETLDDGIQLAAVSDLPDLALDTLTSPATQLTPGSTVAVSVGLINLGSVWTPDADRRATLRLYWDTPDARETLYGNLEIPALAPGVRHAVDLQVPVPLAFRNDERQTLRAELLVEDEDGELDGTNNAAALAIGGMPVPVNLHALSVPGSRIVNLAWDDPADARIAGYRVWVDDENGQPVAMGSSFNPGFADLSALFGFERRYRVSTYSVRGVESELSEPLLAAPAPAIAVDPELPAAVFGNGFE